MELFQKQRQNKSKQKTGYSINRPLVNYLQKEETIPGRWSESQKESLVY